MTVILSAASLFRLDFEVYDTGAAQLLAHLEKPLSLGTFSAGREASCSVDRGLPFGNVIPRDFGRLLA
jgi:hypothetical protein